MRRASPEHYSSCYGMKNTPTAVEVRWNRIGSWRSRSAGGQRVGLGTGSLTRCQYDRLSAGQTDTPTRPTCVWPPQHSGQTVRDHQTEAAVIPKLLAGHYHERVFLLPKLFNHKSPCFTRGDSAGLSTASCKNERGRNVRRYSKKSKSHESHF